MRRLDHTLLDHTLLTQAASSKLPLSPPRALRLVQDLGPAAAWLLKREALQAALRDQCFPSRYRAWLEQFLQRPQLPNNRGAANPVFVVKADELGVTPEALANSALREAFFLPLEWTKGEADDPGLPRALLDLAQQVREHMELADSDWRLRRNTALHLDQVDFSGLNVSCDSAWAALAAALRLAEDGGRPRPDVAVSAAWKKDWGVIDVESVPQKFRAASKFGCTLFFTSAGRAEELQTAGEAQGNIEVRALPAGQDDPCSALGGLLHELQVVPRRADGASLDLRIEYSKGDWGRGREARARREQYILSEITDELAEKRREKSPTRETLDALGEVERSVIVASSPSAARLSVRWIRPQRVLVVFTEDYTDQYGAEPKGHLENCELTDICTQCVEPDAFDEIVRRVRDFLAGASGRCAVDVTGGKKGMTAAATLAAARAGAAVVTIDSENPGLGGHQVGTECLRMVWPPAQAASAPAGGRVLFVTRHAGAREWARRHGFEVDEMVAHLDPAQVRPGDVVIGSLPVNLAAEVCARGGRYFHLVLPVPPEWRGKELTPDDMERFGARVSEFRVASADEVDASGFS